MIRAEHLSKTYRLFEKPSGNLFAALPFVPSPSVREFRALDNVSFELERGAALGIVGPNGCGKSTLLQIVSGILQPTSGRVLVQGRIAALLELGAGFNPEFTGRENVLLSGELMGLSRGEIERAMPAIEAFAGIGAFLDRPVKEYSSGMYVRLAFSTAIHVEPDILVVDEALAVGDAAFANRCVKKFDELRERRVTTLFVSHDLGLVKRLSDRALLLLQGRAAAYGEPKTVIDRYIEHVLSRPDAAPASPAPASASRHGDGAGRITAAFLEAGGRRTQEVRPGDWLRVALQARFDEPVCAPMAGILIRTRIGMEVFGTNSQIEGVELGDYAPGDTLTLAFEFRCLLTPQEFTITVALQHSSGAAIDWIDDAITFRVGHGPARAGVAAFETRVDWTRGPANGETL